MFSALPRTELACGATMLSCRDQIEVIGTGAALFSSRLRSVSHGLPGRICARHVPGKLHASMLP